jgi:carboxypeptidase family protein
MRAKLYLGAAFAIGALAFAYGLTPSAPAMAQEQTLLSGKVTSSSGAPLAGIPIKAHRDNTTITVAVYSNKQGEYSFPGWSDLTPGSYSVSIELADFQHVKKDAIKVTAGKGTKLDFSLTAKDVAYEDATASEIIAALPGTDHQKVLFSQCSNCHSLQWALQIGRTKEQWAKVIRLMAGRAAENHTPDTYAFSQKQFIEPLAEYLASIRGPNSSDKVPFKPRPRPTDEASTNVVVTEYDLPRGGQRDVFMLRGDPAYVWPHDVVTDEKYAYYTDHFSYILGRVDRMTGEAIEMPFELPNGAGRTMVGADGRPGNPGGGAHEVEFDNQGRVLIGMGRATVRYDPKTEKFVNWSSGDAMFGIDPQGNVWHEDQGNLVKIDTSTEQKKLTMYPIPANAGTYDIDTDSKGRTHFYIWRNGKVGIFDPKTLEYADYKTPTPMAGPRRGQIDAQNRLWAAEFYAGQILMFDPDKKQLKEYPLVNGTKPYTAPYAEPYAASVDDKNQIVWTNDFSANRIYKIDIATGKSTEYFTPTNYEVRQLQVEKNAPRPTVWFPNYRPPAKLVKMQVR